MISSQTAFVAGKITDTIFLFPLSPHKQPYHTHAHIVCSISVYLSCSLSLLHAHTHSLLHLTLIHFSLIVEERSDPVTGEMKIAKLQAPRLPAWEGYDGSDDEEMEEGTHWCIEPVK